MSDRQTRPLNFAVFGCGFWSRFQLAAWRELSGVQCVALYNRTVEKALALAHEFGIAERCVYGDPEALLRNEDVDFVDVVTSPETHAQMVSLVAQYRKPVIVQKPMSDQLESARRMLADCQTAGIPLLVHENWRWQAPIRRLSAIIAAGHIGVPFRARLSYLTAFRVYENQPFLRTAERFILADMGPHIFDTIRFLFGEVRQLYCRTRNVNPEVCGEDVASVLIETVRHVLVSCELSYFSRIETDRFPQTFILVEGDRGTVELKPDYEITITTASGTYRECAEPVLYQWADPRYAVVHASIVDCHRDLLRALRGEAPAETRGEDNLRSLELVEAAYRSAASGRALSLPLPLVESNEQ